MSNGSTAGRIPGRAGPEPGRIAFVRQRRYLVEDVAEPGREAHRGGTARGHGPAATLTGGCRSGLRRRRAFPGQRHGNLMMTSSVANGQPDHYDDQSYDNR